MRNGKYYKTRSVLSAECRFYHYEFCVCRYSLAGYQKDRQGQGDRDGRKNPAERCCRPCLSRRGDSKGSLEILQEIQRQGLRFHRRHKFCLLSEKGDQGGLHPRSPFRTDGV